MTTLMINPDAVAERMSLKLDENLQGEHRWMTQALQRIRARFSAVNAVEISDVDAERLLLSLRRQGPPKEPRAFRNCCGLISREIEIDGARWSALADNQVFSAVIDEFQSDQLSPTWQQRCARALLYSFLSTEVPLHPEKHDTALINWQVLGAKLAEFASQHQERRFGMLLCQHNQLLWPGADRHFAERADGDPPQDLDEMARSIGIPETGWFWPSVTRAQINLLKRKPRREFEQKWPDLLDRAEGHKVVLDDCLASIMEQFAAYQPRDRESAERLIKLAIELWGHPFSPNNQWEARLDAATINVFRPWVSEELIDLFFEFLATDSRTDQTRPTFWKQYAPLITEIYVIHGRTLNSAAKKHLNELRRTMGSRRVRTLSENVHVFVMRIGDVYFCEISEHGNALYCHTEEFVHENLDRPGRISLKTIKTPYGLPNAVYMPNRWIHKSGWQSDFARKISRLTGEKIPNRSHV